MIIVIALSLALSPVISHAQSVHGPYVSVAGGINKMMHEDVHLSVDGLPGSTVSGEVRTKTGPVVAIAVGMPFRTHWRAELEGDYRLDRISGELGLVGQQNATGTETKYGTMVNVLHECSAGAFAPYVGAGAGLQFVKTSGLSGTNGVRTVTVAGDTQSAPAYQGIVGLAFRIRGMTVTLEYRYMALTGERRYKGAAVIPGVGTFPMTDLSEDNRNHSVLLGLRLPFRR
jgi:opacity protein-like surface antigen